MKSHIYEVRAFGATGDGQTLDSAAINRAIAAAAAAGGGTVHFSAGTYLSYSIRLQSNITLFLDQGATLLAADPPPQPDQPGYDLPEPNPNTAYQDFGHSHWHNSLIWGENLENVAILGPGVIYGRGLTRTGPGPRRGGGGGLAAGDFPDSLGMPRGNSTAAPANFAPSGFSDAPGAPGFGGVPGRGFGAERPGMGNKAIALKSCRNVILRDFSILQGGHFALLATGVDNFTIDNVKVDTNRDGFDIDCCRNVRISNCCVNSPNDDAIVLKSSYALGTPRACENIAIVNCQVSGFDPGSFLDGTYRTTQTRAPDREGPTGRIKFGTESNGGFKNIAITNCVFVHCRGLALETVDGGTIEDVTIDNLVMRDVFNSAIFLRLGNRARGPQGSPVGAIRRVNISNVVASGVDARFPCVLSGLPGHDIEDVTLSNIRVVSAGGITMDEVSQQPLALVSPFYAGRRGAATSPRDPFDPPEHDAGYPEPSMFGLLPAWGLYARHVNGLTVRDANFSCVVPDGRPVLVLQNVTHARIDGIETNSPGQANDGTPLFVLRQVQDFTSHSAVQQSAVLPDTHRDAVSGQESL